MNANKQILLIEDDVDLAEVIIAFFRQKGIKVFHYENPLSAFSDLMSHQLRVDAILSDLNLPQLSGLELIKKLNASGLTTPIILVTVSNDVDIAVQAIQAGAYDFVVKPLHFPQLYISVQRAFRLNKLSAENQTLKKAVELSRGINLEGIVGKSEKIKTVLELAKRAAKSTATIFITGESGVGKEVFAKAIHQWSPRKNAPLVAINCSAIPENLLESELFGHAKGAFTGATEKKIGLFEEAEGGTLFLDEIGDLNLPLQAKLLRVLQDRKIRRIGENQMRSVDVRVITATHKDLRTEVKEKRFREDLFFRLNVIPVHVPPLRDRKEDIIPLAEFFLKKYNALNNTEIASFSQSAKEFLLKQLWKGNVRELENAIERAVVLSTSNEIDVDALTMLDEMKEIESEAESISSASSNSFIFKYGDQFAPLEEIEKKYIQHIFEKNNRVRESTARILGIDRKTLYRKLQEIERV